MLFVGTEPLVSTMELPHVMAARDSSEEVSGRSMHTAADSPETAQLTRIKGTSVAIVD